MISKVVLAIVIFLVLPELLGLLVVRFTKKDKHNVLLSLATGYLIEFGILEIISIITIIKTYSIISFVETTMIIIGLLSSISVIVNFRSIVLFFREMAYGIKKTPKVLAIIVIFLIGIQIYFPVKYAHIDDDDAHYVASAVTDIEKNTMYRYSSTTGVSIKPRSKYLFSYFMSYYSYVSVLLNVHPAIVAHTILPAVFISLVYIVYYELSKELFEDNKKKMWLFLLFMCIVNMFGNYSIRSNFTFLLFRIWQGKAMLANFVLPLAILFILKIDKSENEFIYYLLLFLTSLGGAYTTSMSIGFIPITIILLGLSMEVAKFKEKSFKDHALNMVIFLSCCIPNLLAGLGYVLYK